MKTGRSLQELAGELDRQVKTRKDYLASSGALSMDIFHDEVRKVPKLAGINGEALGLTDYAHGQMADTLGIPRKYYDRMLGEAPELLTTNVNNWLQKDDKKRMVRTLDGRVRAFLSASYRPLDNYDLAGISLPILTEIGANVVSAELTETRMYIKAILPSLQTEVTGSKQKGDVVQAGLVISNSEVGAGAVRIEPLIYRLVCTNGMIAPDSSLRKYHVGKGADVDGVRELLSDEARIADDRAFWLKVRDVVRGAFSQDVFMGIVQKMELASQVKIEGSVTEVVQLTGKRFNLQEGATKNVLNHLIEGGDLTKYGLSNAITRASQDADEYEQATELERVGGKIIELSHEEWKGLNS